MPMTSSVGGGGGARKMAERLAWGVLSLHKAPRLFKGDVAWPEAAKPKS